MNDVVSLPARLDATTAPELMAELLAYDHAADIRLDAAKTVHIGAMGAQVLLSACRTADASNRTLSIDNLQPRAHQQLSLMGLTELTTPKEAT
ncbi:STAS domain-containing protein [Tateyamaria omphalii]|uniref:STAS domain-containing protein n=1 Tax=Tateyamaria omphalii TaxID=299262 RepID=A0A1P8MU38_9RHOB|nr:STAS domain-containing protein [Tateyamaria omphalii]APX11449.1 hypothetical protein BWR18_06960 [Tateyamaria omphalii]